MHRPPYFFVLGSVLWLGFSCASAVEFGRVTNATLLGQPLDFSVRVKPGTDDNISAESSCVSAKVFVGSREISSSNVRVSVDVAANADEKILRVTTSTPVDEPVVSVNLVLDCPAHLTRRFLGFVDAPDIKPPPLEIAESVPVAEPGPATTPTASAVASIVVARTQAPSSITALPVTAPAPAIAEKKKLKPSKPTRRVTEAASAKAAASAARPSAFAVVPAPPKVPKRSAKASTARLRLGPADVSAKSGSVRPRTSGKAQAADSTVSQLLPVLEALIERSAADRERVRVLEKSLAQLRKESQFAQTKLAQMQARLRAVQGAGNTNPLVYILAALVAALVGAVGVLLWKVSIDKRTTDWLVQSLHVERSHAKLELEPEHGSQRTDNVDATVAPLAPVTRKAAPAEDFSHSTHAANATTASVPAAAAAAAALPESPKEMSVEELIDLEQRVEFFILLGQDEAAIEVLLSSLEVTSDSNPMPFLRLLEIYRRRDERGAYEQIRQRFNRRFNAYARDWDSESQDGRALEDYPHVLAKLQLLWETPRRALQALKTALLRRQAGGGTFDLPAYRDLLVLHAIAQDLVGSEDAAPGVDLFIPVAGEGGQA